jgi:hypothetical protein
MASFPSTTVQPSPDVVSRRLGDSAVLVHLETNRVFELNETGARVWELLHDGLTCEQIADRLAAEFEVDHDRAASTVLELVSDLRREGLLRP